MKQAVLVSFWVILRLFLSLSAYMSLSTLVLKKLKLYLSLKEKRLTKHVINLCDSFKLEFFRF